MTNNAIQCYVNKSDGFLNAKNQDNEKIVEKYKKEIPDTEPKCLNDLLIISLDDSYPKFRQTFVFNGSPYFHAVIA